MFVSKNPIFLEKEFLLRDSGNKVELKEVQDAQADANQLPEPKAEIHRDEIAIGPLKPKCFVGLVGYVLF